MAGGRHDGVHGEGGGRAHDGADIVRIGDLVERQDERARRQRLERRRGQRIGFEIEPLMHGVRLDETADVAGPHELRPEAQIRHGLFEPPRRVLGGEQPPQRTPRVAQRLHHRMPAVEDHDLVRAAVCAPAGLPILRGSSWPVHEAALQESEGDLI